MESEDGKRMHDAADTAGTYLAKAVRMIDEQFGEPGYAKAHPELVAAFMAACSADFAAGMVSASLRSVGEAIDSAGGWGASR